MWILTAPSCKTQREWVFKSTYEAGLKKGSLVFVLYLQIRHAEIVKILVEKKPIRLLVILIAFCFQINEDYFDALLSVRILGSLRNK